MMVQGLLLSIQLPKQHHTQIIWGGLYGSAASLAISELAQAAAAPLLLIAPTIQQAMELQAAIAFFAPEITLTSFPDWEMLPYDHFSPHEDIVSERLRTLYHLPRMQKGIVIAALPTLLHHLMPAEYLEANTFVLGCGDIFNIGTARNKLTQAGYYVVNQVMRLGKFAAWIKPR